MPFVILENAKRPLYVFFNGMCVFYGCDTCDKWSKSRSNKEMKEKDNLDLMVYINNLIPSGRTEVVLDTVNYNYVWEDTNGFKISMAM